MQEVGKAGYGGVPEPLPPKRRAVRRPLLAPGQALWRAAARRPRARPFGAALPGHPAGGVSAGAAPPPQALFDADKFKCLHEGVVGLEEQNGIHSLDGAVYLASGLVECGWKGDNWRATVDTADADAVPTEAEWALFAAANDANMAAALVYGPTCAVQAGDRVVVVSGEHRERRGALGCDQDGEREQGADIVVPVGRVRHHVLSTPRPIEGSWKADPSTGRARCALTDGAHKMVQVGLGDIQLALGIGDVVRIRRGPRAGSVGLVAGSLGKAETEFLPCDPGRSRRYLAALSRPGALQGSSDDAAYCVPVADLEPLDEVVYAVAPGARPKRPSDVSKAVKAEMWTGKGYEVQVVHRHERKACFGTVIGYVEGASTRLPYDSIEFKRDENGKLRLRWLETDGGVKLKVQIEMGLEVVDATMEQCVHRKSGLPLQLHQILEVIGGSSGEDDEKPAQLPEVPAAAPLPRTTSVPEDIVGETTGKWLTRPQLVGKRIDVRVEGVMKSAYRRAVTNRALLREGKEGFLAPLTRPVVNLRDGVKMRLEPFWESRVIIIGPDVDGSWERVGLYAETVPGRVGLQREGGALRRPVGWFDLSSLCRAINEPWPSTGDTVLEATDFDAEPPES
ncbi:hypothetical protein MSAN_01359800 [Mycena sanguinolenta]|uniref:Uncharacterized protein n=1 Tax=Mycena sanguinolenta TaxID=230812 RepID=A0A8H6YAW0_9AGAR|nr:hypothetical protein MSAN_01359800 [Mycena sanguinolenta]